MFNFLKIFFIKKANYKLVEKILIKEKFVYTDKDIKYILNGNQKGVRYGGIVLERIEGGDHQKRFIKIMLDGKMKTYKLFCRQVKVADLLNKDNKITFPTMAVIKSSLESKIPYAVFETRENGNNFGFMNDDRIFYEQITDQEIKNLVNTMYSFHLSGFNIDPKVWKYVRNIKLDFYFYKKGVKKYLSKKIVHKDKDGRIYEDTVENLLKMYINLPDIKNRILKIFKDKLYLADILKNKNGYYLIHADMQLDNVYKHKNGSFEMLDFEWVGRSQSSIIAIMYDYGNLRARAWSSPRFQLLLDNAMIEVGNNYYKDDTIVKTGMQLGLLRSSLMMSRYHLDFKNTVKKDRRTEEDYQNMYPRALATLVDVLQQN